MTTAGEAVSLVDHLVSYRAHLMRDKQNRGKKAGGSNGLKEGIIISQHLPKLSFQLVQVLYV